MMSTPHDKGSLQPLRHEAAPAPEDARMAALFGQVDPLDPLSEITALRIRRGLERAIEAREARRFPVWARRAVAVAASLFLLETAAAAAIAAWPSARHRIFGTEQKAQVLAPLPVPVDASPTAQPAVGAPAEAINVPSVVEAPAPSPAPSVVAAPETRRAPRPRPLTAMGPAPVSPAGLSPQRSPISAVHPTSAADDSDVRLYTQALSQLNVQHDAPGALRTLQAYRQQHPNGLFQNEAEVAEVRADLQVGKRADALLLLDAMQSQGFRDVPQATELRLLRGELLGMDGRCGEAIAALAPFIDGAADGLANGLDRERAIYSRVTCRAHLGDEAGSRQDARDYLREFPTGRFANRIRADLAKHPGVAE